MKHIITKNLDSIIRRTNKKKEKRIVRAERSIEIRKLCKIDG